MSEIQKGHLDRAAYIYVRQSSLTQVEQNLEPSTAIRPGRPR